MFDKTYIIGSGGYGEVYKAELEIFDINHSLKIESKNKCQLPKKHKTVAIKRILNRKDEQGTEGFLMELNVLSKCKHPNIVFLLGYCMEDSEMILVYEYLANGSLDDYLGCANNKKNFTWSERIRVCLDIAYGIDYLHSTTKIKKMIIHRDIKSDNILFGDNWEVKLADFGLSRVHTNQSIGTIMTNNIAGTNLYLDPAYERHRKLKKESDIYSFGIVLFEILTGKLTYDSAYIMQDTRGIAPIARKHFKQGTIKEMVDSKIMDEAHEIFSSLKIGTTQASLDIFSTIAYRCLAKNQDDRPIIKDIIEELQKALSYDQEHRKGILKISLQDIKENFSDKNCIRTEEHWKIYVGEMPSHAERKTILIKRLNKSSQEVVFFTELEVLYKHKHENIIRCVGYCIEDDEQIIVYEHAPNGSLSMHLNKVSLGWKERLKICIDVAVGLHFLHEGVGTKEMVVHRNLKSSSIVLNSDFKAKISDFGFSSITPISKHNNYAYNVFFPINTTPYDEWEMKFLTKQSDIYAFGVVLFQILSGRLALENYYIKEGELDELVFPGIKEQIAPLSRATFHKIADQCIHHIRLCRPTAHDVEVQLRKALEIQEIWEPKMRKDVKTIHLSESSGIDSKEFPFQDGRVWLHGERTELVSAIEFTYLNHRSHRWQSLQGSRFQKVAVMLDTWNLMIEIKTRCQYFSQDYGVYLVFKFRDLRKFSSQPMYVNLKYRKGSETLHAYFATWRDEEWMMIELFRMLNHKEAGNVHRFLLESFSSSCCGDDVIYVEGIEFRAIDNVKNEEITLLQETQQVSVSNSIVNQVQQVFKRRWNYDEFKRWRNYDESEKNIWQSEVNGKKHLRLSAKKVLLNFPNVYLFASKPSTHSRFEDEVKLLPQKVFYIDCMIKSEMLSQDTEYVCYLVFKLSKNSDELHCPVRVRDLQPQENKEAEIIYFISPDPWNIHAITHVPKQREDGWMEVNVWKFSLNHEHENGYVPVNLKLMSYEGTMTGLIIRGIEFRPM